MKRQEIFDYAGKVYGTVPEYLWKQYPDYAVLRMKDTDKWYAVVMDVSRDKLGLEGSGKAEILNVKCDPQMTASLVQAHGFLPGYHMNKNHWVSILLDGTVEEITILDFLDRSYELVESCAGKKAHTAG